MNKPARKYTLGEAALITGKTSQTINRHKLKGKLSCEMIEKVAHYEASELLRVYGNDINFDIVNVQNENRKSAPVVQSAKDGEAPLKVQVLEEKLNSANKQIEILSEERRRERDQLQERIDHLETTVSKTQENQKTLLLENQKTKEGQGDEWQTAISELKDQVANQEKASHEKFEVMVKEKTDIEKANKIFKLTAIIFIGVAIAVTIYALIEQGIIQLN